MRSSSGPLRRRAWRARSLSRQRQRRDGACPHGHGFVAATSRKRVGKIARALAAHDGDAAVLQRLAQRLQRRARELGQLVEEQDAVVGQARLAGRGHAAAADEADGGDQVVRRAERPLGAPARPPRCMPGDAVDARHLDGLRRATAAAGSTAGAARASSCRRRAGPRSAGCGAGGRDGERLDDVGVTADVGQVGVAHGKRERGLVGDRAAAGARPRRISATCARLLAPSTSSPRRGRPPARAGAGGRARRARLGPSLRHRERTAARTDLAAEPELAEDRVALERVGRDVAAARRGSRTRSRGRSPGPPCAATPAQG